MPTTKLLLKESVKHLGRVGDVVEVSPGYARNYLLPHHLAVQPTPGNIRRVEEIRKEIERVEREKRGEQERLLAQLAGVEVSIERRANEQGHLFGSVSATDIAHALQTQGFNIEPNDINLHGKLDRIDVFTVEVQFADDLKTDIKTWVTPDAESKAAIDAAKKAAAVEPPPAGNFERA
jgi:large subunit ribosomal protein L9